MADFKFNVTWGDISSKTNYKDKDDKTSYKDERFWTLSKDENGKGAAIIRLLVDKNSVPFVNVYNCGLREFNETDKKYYWYIRDLPSTIKAPDPLNELWSELYNHSAAGRDEAKNFGRRETFYTNILVVKDPGNPENNGKVFLWKFGKKLLDKFMSALNPSEQERELGEKPKELYHPLNGNNVALKIKNVAGFPNYDDTSIMDASKAFKDEKEAETAILTKTYPLEEFITADHYEDYNKLKDDLIKFCKKYKAKHLSQQEFDSIVAKTFNIEFGSSYEPVVAKKEKTLYEKQYEASVAKEKEAKEAKVKKEVEKIKEAEAKVEDDIDDLLDDLDL